MLLNNLCETFNSVIKEARDKPIVTCFKWVRRYVMRRNAEKWEGIQKYEGRFMPYVGKVLEWVAEAATRCSVCPSRLDVWEVDTIHDRYVVDLKDKTCSYFRWQLTGIPCPHAYACIVKKRARPEDFVDACYSKERYLEAYTPHIKAMPGIKHWAKSDLQQPLPPLLKKQAGRPKLKKRKKEVGEDEERKYVKRGGKPNKCSNCKETGHNTVTCKKPLVVTELDKGGRPTSMNKWNQNQRKKKGKEASKTGTGNNAGYSQSGSHQPQPSQQQLPLLQAQQVQAQQASPTFRQKLQVRGQKKKALSDL